MSQANPRRRLVTGGKVVTTDAVLDHGWIVLEADQVGAVGDGPPPAGDYDEITELAGGYVLPGFIDLHVHGGAGAGFDDGGRAIATGLAAHRAHGTTRSLLSLISNPVDRERRAIVDAADYAATDPSVLGLHLEGPFLSEARKGAHDPSVLIDPDPGVLEDFLAAGAGTIKVVTLAPERAGGLAAIQYLVAQGVHAAVGHSDAGYDQARAAFDAGADLVTHAFNGMRPLHHRDPAIIGAAMDSPHVVLEAINDGVHLHPATVRLLRSIAPGRLALITDAMSATCAGDGRYKLGAFDVDVRGGVARLAGQDAIAGSTLTMDVAVQRAVQVVGIPVLDAVAAASLTPARLLGVADRFGAIADGRAADLVFTDDDFAVRAVLAGGAWVDDRRP